MASAISFSTESQCPPSIPKAPTPASFPVVVFCRILPSTANLMLSILGHLDIVRSVFSLLLQTLSLWSVASTACFCSSFNSLNSSTNANHQTPEHGNDITIVVVIITMILISVKSKLAIRSHHLGGNHGQNTALLHSYDLLRRS